MMIHKHSTDIKDHLEFLGFDVEIIKTDNSKIDTIAAKSESRSNLYIQTDEDFSLITSTYTGYDPKALKSEDFFTDLNQINSESVYTKWYYILNEAEKDLRIMTSVTYLRYDKKSFGLLLEFFEQDIRAYQSRLAKYVKS